MTKEQALEILQNVAKQARLTYQEHVTVDQAIAVLKEALLQKETNSNKK